MPEILIKIIEPNGGDYLNDYKTFLTNRKTNKKQTKEGRKPKETEEKRRQKKCRKY